MRKPVNYGNNPDQSLNPCIDKSPLDYPVNIDAPPPNCPPDIPTESQKSVPDRHEFFGLLEQNSREKVGIGVQANCDPMQTGQIVNDVPEGTSRTNIYRYTKALRGCDEAMRDLFTNLVVIDEDGRYFPVPIISATQERAVSHILGDNVRKDNSGVVDRIRLPLMSIYSSSMEFDQSRYTYHQALDYGRSLRPDWKPAWTIQESRHPRDTVFGVARGIPVNIGYTLFIWTLYLEDMNQIIEQVITKFSPVAYIRVRGINWETIVKLNSIANNINVEPGDKTQRVIKYQFNFTTEAYIPQPIVRKKAVLTTKVDFLDNLDAENTTEVLDRLEEAAKE